MMTTGEIVGRVTIQTLFCAPAIWFVYRTIVRVYREWSSERNVFRLLLRTIVSIVSIPLCALVLYATDYICLGEFDAFEMQEFIFLLRLDGFSTVYAPKGEYYECSWAPFRHVSKYALHTRKDAKFLIIGTGINTPGADWQILAAGDSIVYKISEIQYGKRFLSSAPPRSAVFVSTVSIRDIQKFLPDIKTLENIIDCSDEVYAWVEALPCVNAPGDFFCEISDSLDMRSDSVYSTHSPSQVRHDIYYKKGRCDWKHDKHAKSASYSFYRMNLDDHHVSDTEDVTAIIPEYYDW